MGHFRAELILVFFSENGIPACRFSCNLVVTGLNTKIILDNNVYFLIATFAHLV